MATQKGLGKGLGALLGDYNDTPTEKSPYQLLPIYKVEPNPNQPRHDFDEEELENLAESIAEHGVVQPLTVRELKSGYYQIIAGERRWRAARLANLSEIPAVIIEADDRKAMELALQTNRFRHWTSFLKVINQIFTIILSVCCNFHYVIEIKFFFCHTKQFIFAIFKHSKTNSKNKILGTRFPNWIVLAFYRTKN